MNTWIEVITYPETELEDFILTWPHRVIWINEDDDGVPYAIWHVHCPLGVPIALSQCKITTR